MKLAILAVLLSFDDAVPVLQTAWVELRVDPSADATTIGIDALITEIARALRTSFGKE